MRLTELTLAIAIYASVSGIATPIAMQQINDAKNAVYAYNAKILQQAVEIYRIENGHYPNILDDLVQAGYFRELPLNPLTGSVDFEYDCETGEVKGL
jgi:general secretion pathway protein G